MLPGWRVGVRYDLDENSHLLGYVRRGVENANETGQYSMVCCYPLHILMRSGPHGAQAQTSSGLGPGCVKTCARRECAELFSPFSSFEDDCQCCSFPIQRNRDKISTRKSDVGVFTQPGSKADLKPPMIEVRSSPGSGHSSGRRLRQLCARMRPHRNGRSGPVSWRAGLPAMREPAQLGRPRRNSMIAALTCAGRSCWVQWPQPASIWRSRRSGTCCFMLAICSAAPGNATTRS
jgi:hypothetical protein